MLKRFAALSFFVLLCATSAAYAQDEEKKERAEAYQTESSGTIVDPSLYDIRTGRRMVRGLDRVIDPDEYRVGPWDEFLLVVRGGNDVRMQLRVLPEGTVMLPNVGALHVAGLTITEFRAELRKRLESYYRNVEIDCQLMVPRTLVVYVLGEVAAPGAVEVFAPFRLDMALRGAGGISERGSSRYIEIRRDGEPPRRVDYQRFIRLGENSQNPGLSEGATVYVPSRGPSCNIVGEVWRGGTYEILPGETVADMVELAGGFTPNVDTTRIVIERLDATDRLSVTELPWKQAATRELQDRDVVVIPDRQSYPGTDFVRVYGGGGREGKIYVQEGETLASFLPRFQRLTEGSDRTRAVVERKTESGETRYIPVDLERVMAGEGGGDIVLQPGDVIGIPKYPESVYVIGEVTAPGPIGFQRGLPAGHYIALAGGPTEGGSIDRIEIVAIDGSKRDGDRESTVYRGETILVKTKRSKVFGAIFGSVAAAASLILSIIAVSQN